jgi:Flp pilus assembly pilin Flp
MFGAAVGAGAIWTNGSEIELPSSPRAATTEAVATREARTMNRSSNSALLRDETGASSAEFAVLLCVIVIATIGLWFKFGASLASIIN